MKFPGLCLADELLEERLERQVTAMAFKIAPKYPTLPKWWACFKVCGAENGPDVSISILLARSGCK